MKDNFLNKIIVNMIMFILLAVMAELFIFNYQCFTTVNENEVVVPLDYCSYEGVKEQLEDGSVILDSGENGAFLQFSIKDSGIKLKNIALKVSCTDGNETWWGYMRTPYAFINSTSVKATVMLSGETDNTILRERMLYGKEGRWDIINLPYKKDTQMLTIQLSGVKGSTLHLEGLSLNTRVPMHFIPLRAVAVFMFLAFLYHMREKSFVWTDSLLDDKGKMKRVYIALSLAVLLALAVFTPVMLSKSSVFIQSENAFHPYTDLARALAKGQLYLDIEPSAELLALEDPYDPVAREEAEAPFQLDYAFYEGKYYIYFGVIPCLLLYLPWYLITGSDIPGWVAMTVMLLLCYVGLWLVIKNLIRRYRSTVALGPAVLIWMGAASLLSLPAAMGDASNYYAPMLAAIDCFLFGMALGLSAADALDAENTKKGRILLCFSSLLMAFIAGCRPQLVLGAACTLPFILHLLFEKRDGKYRLNIANCVVFAIPYIIVAAGLMLYNALRFGSPFDFGAMKNLTFAFLSNAGFNLTAAGAGIFYYLFRLPHLTGFYPYLDRSSLEWSNPNLLASHPSTGGIFMLYPVLFLAFACFVKTQKGKTTELKWTGITAIVLVPVLAAITAAMGGLMDRYRMDIAPFAALALVCGILCFASSEIKKPSVRIRRIVLIVLVVLAAVVSGLTYGTEGLNYLKDVNPEAYMDIAKAIEFWR